MNEPATDPLKTALVSQFGAAFDMLEQAVKQCPDALWTGAAWLKRE